MVERAKELDMEYDGESKFFQLSRLKDHKCRVQNKTMKDFDDSFNFVVGFHS